MEEDIQVIDLNTEIQTTQKTEHVADVPVIQVPFQKQETESATEINQDPPLVKKENQNKIQFWAKKDGYRLIALVIVSFTLISVKIGLLFLPRDNSILRSNPGEVSHHVTVIKKCINITVKHSSDIMNSNVSCISTSFELIRANHLENSEGATLMIMNKKISVDENKDIGKNRRLQTVNSSNNQAQSTGNLTECSLDDYSCQKIMNSLPMVHVEFDQYNNSLKRIEFPKNVSDDDKVDLLTQVSHFFIGLNSTQINKQNSPNDILTETVRGNETFVGKLVETQRNNKNLEITYSVINSSKSHEAPLACEHKLQIDLDQKRITESNLKESRSIVQTDAESSNKARLLSEVSEGCQLESTTSTQTLFLSILSNSNMSKSLETLMKNQELDVYTPEDINLFAEAIRKKRSGNTGTDQTETLTKSKEQSNGNRILQTGKTILTKSDNLIEISILKMKIGLRSAITVITGDTFDQDQYLNNIQLLVNGDPKLILISFKEYLVKKLTQYHWSDTFNKPVISFCYPGLYIVLDICGSLNIKVNYGYDVAITNTNIGTDISFIFTPYLKAGVQANAYVEAAFLRGGLDITGVAFDLSVPTKLLIKFNPPSATLDIKAEYRSFSFETSAWYQLLKLFGWGDKHTIIEYSSHNSGVASSKQLYKGVLEAYTHAPPNSPPPVSKPPTIQPSPGSEKICSPNLLFLLLILVAAFI